MLTLKSKQSISYEEMQNQVNRLMEQNTKLKDSLFLQSLELEKEKDLRKKQTQIVMGKYNRLEKQKQQTGRRCQELIQIILKNNIYFEDNSIIKSKTILDFEKQSTVKPNANDSKVTTGRSSRIQEAESPNLLNKVLQQIVSTQRSRCFQTPIKRESISHIRSKDSSLLTYKQLNRSRSIIRSSIDKDEITIPPRHRKSYIQKLKVSTL